MSRRIETAAFLILVLTTACGSLRKEVRYSTVAEKIEDELGLNNRRAPIPPEAMAAYRAEFWANSNRVFPGEPEGETWFIPHQVRVERVSPPPPELTRPVIVTALVDGEVTEDHAQWWYQHRSGLVTLRVNALFSQDRQFLEVRDSGIVDVLEEY